MNVLIFGLGLHNGGLSAAMYYLRRNHKVIVTDIQGANSFGSVINSLQKAGAVLHVGGHREDDFLWADIIIKNPAIPPHNPFFTSKDYITTDIIELLKFLTTYPHSHIIVVTGTKGKSSTTYAIAQILEKFECMVFMGGNIGVSGFSLIEEIEKVDMNSPLYVVLELSSWQIRDLCIYGDDIDLTFDSIIVTSLYPDHGDYYSDVEAYYKEKLQILSMRATSKYMSIQAKQSTDDGSFDGTWLADDQIIIRPLVDMGFDISRVQKALQASKKLAHRGEVVRSIAHIVWINDSSATIPEAMNYTLSKIVTPYILIFGGSDKNCNIEASLHYIKKATSLVLLDGSFTHSSIIPLLSFHAISFSGPFTTMNEAVLEGYNKAKEFGKPISVVLSPGAASFGLFRHSDERGNKFKECVLQLS